MIQIAIYFSDEPRSCRTSRGPDNPAQMLHNHRQSRLNVMGIEGSEVTYPLDSVMWAFHLSMPLDCQCR
jgi:hypothetical protein